MGAAGAVLMLGVSAVLGAAGEKDKAAGWTLRWSQNAKLPSNFRQFEVERADGSAMTAFLAGSGGKPEMRKPLMIYLDGSGAQSLFTTADGRTGVGVFGLLARAGHERCHVAAVEKRGAVFGQRGKPGSGEGASAEYTRFATYEDRVADIRLLLDVLSVPPVVDPGRIILVGHSEGADVAAGVAEEDPRVTHVAVLSGGGATQMFDLTVLLRKRMVREGRSEAQIDEAVRKLEAQYRDIFRDPRSETRFFMGHAYRRWSSFFRHPTADALVRGRAKLFLAHGTEDTSVPIESFDLLVVELLRAGRKNVVVRRYPGRGHGLQPPGAANRPPMSDVFEDVVEWACGSGS
jgi:pimeloyl-ACP methyl ester carboxylesterase